MRTFVVRRVLLLVGAVLVIPPLGLVYAPAIVLVLIVAAAAVGDLAIAWLRWAKKADADA